jgi:uncharacterized delta-60 repeat protein
MILDTGCCIHPPSLQPDGKFLVFDGSHAPFSSINGVKVPRPGFARLNPDGSLDRNFIPAVTPANSDVYYAQSDAVRPLTDGRILIFDGTALRALKPNGELDVAFQPDLPIPQPLAIAEDGAGKLMIAAEFSLCTSAGCPFTVFRLNQNGSLDSTFTPATTDGAVSNLLLLSDGKILVAGSFGSISGVARPNLARLNPNGAIDQSFKPDLVAEGFQSAIIALDKENILICIPARVAFYPLIRRLRPDGSLDKAFPVRLFGGDNPQPYLQSIVPQGGRLRIQGGFQAVNGFPVQGGIARLLLDEAPETAAAIAPRTNSDYWDPQIRDLFWNHGVEGMGQAEITVRRLGNVRGPATVNYQTQDGAAKAGQDYTTVAGALSFEPFEVEQSFLLPILDDGEIEPDETVQLVLSPGSGVTSVGPSTTFVIHGDQVRVQSLTRNAAGGFDIFFQSIPGGRYVLEGSTNLKDWKKVLGSDSSFMSEGLYSSGFVEMDRLTPSGYHFFRIKREF